jgi:hypothetical protein
MPTVKLSGPSGVSLSFALTEVLPATSPTIASARVRLTGEPEILKRIRVGDLDDTLDTRSARVVDVARQTNPLELDVTLRLGIDNSGGGWTYRSRTIKAGAPFTLATDQYVVRGTVLDVSDAREAASK